MCNLYSHSETAHGKSLWIHQKEQKNYPFPNQVVGFRPRPHVSGYFRIRNFFVPDSATVHTYPANSTANPEKNKYALQSGKKYIRNESDNVWTGNPDIFLSDDVKSVSNLSPNNREF